MGDVTNMPATKDTNHLVVILAYHYPPENAIGAARPYRFVKYLSRLGYTCRVITAADQSGRDDPNTDYIEDPFATRPRRSLSWQLERAVRKIFLPGELGMQWSYRAAEAARICIEAHRGARVTILSSFPPLGSHFAGWQLARNNKLAWIVDCRDPFADEFTDRYRSVSQKQVYRWIERVAVRRADRVIVNTDANMAQLKGKFPSLAYKFHNIWNGFDPEERVRPLPVLSRNCKTLSHVGELYNGRDVTPVLESIARLTAANRLPAGSVRVRLIGPAEPACLPSAEFLHRARSEGWLDLVPERIPQRAARQAAQSSNGLLLMQSGSSVHIPAKIFEYLQIGRPILAFIHPNSPAERLLERSGVPFRCVYAGTAPEATDNIVAEFFDLPSTPVAPSSWFEEEFNAEKQTLQLDAIIRSLHNQPARDIPPLAAVSVEANGSEHIEDTGIYERSANASIDHARP